MRTLIHNIGLLAGILPPGKQRLTGPEMATMQTLTNAWLLTENGLIADFGTAESLPPHLRPLLHRPPDTHAEQAVKTLDAQRGLLLPCFCDPHTHLVYAGSREQEFVDKIRGMTYADIARRGGGILNSADRLHQASEDDLYRQAMGRIGEIRSKGTGCVEIKSGYGLTTEDELKMLRVIRRISQNTDLHVAATFLGAHAVGRAYQGRQDEYVDLVAREMIPAVAREHLAEFIDVFCDEGFFTPEQTGRILEAGARHGLRPKIHAEELAPSGGVAVAVRHRALSVDHLESMGEASIALLRQSATMPTLLPGTSFFLNLPYAPARRLIDSGIGIALASDYNPGSTPSGDMKFILSLACIKMRLLPEEALNAATINAAYAMGCADRYGSITRGKRAAMQLLDAPSLDFIPYAYTTGLVKQLMLA